MNLKLGDLLNGYLVIFIIIIIKKRKRKKEKPFLKLSLSNRTSCLIKH
jgi:hypothetical protein